MSSEEHFNKMRVEYSKGALDEGHVNPDPFAQFREWFDVAVKSEPTEANACALATTGSDQQPAVRMLLLKSLDERGFVFYTNYNSRKGRQLLENSRAALLFYWSTIERQVRIEGIVERVTRQESEVYFHSRPRNSQVGAAASRQSERCASRATIEHEARELSQSVGEGIIECPPHWGGYRLIPARFEYWQGRPDRLHDRITFERAGNSWNIGRLWP